jgi:hypothetical protein
MDYAVMLLFHEEHKYLVIDLDHSNVQVETDPDGAMRILVRPITIAPQIAEEMIPNDTHYTQR